MEIINKQTKVVCSDAEFRLANAEASLPAVLTADVLAVFNCAPVLPTPAPEPGRYQVCSRDGVGQDSSGNYVEKWKLTEITDAGQKARIDQELNRIERDRKKSQRQQQVERIVVAVGAKQFDGDEDSQNRMARAIVAMQAANVPQTRWILADNTVVQVTVAELQQALVAAGQAQTDLWLI